MKWFTSWVWDDTKHDWVKVMHKKAWQKSKSDRYSGNTAARIVRKKRRAGRKATARLSSEGKPDKAPKGKNFMSNEERKWILIREWLSGDLDANVDLMHTLAKVAQEIGVKLYVAEGTRSYAEQLRLWALKKAGKISWPVAFPGTSRHGTGNAMDVRKSEAHGTPNLGDIPGARTSMAKHGLCLPVPGEPWHTEFGNDWRA